jgi:hypothetical protein
MSNSIASALEDRNLPLLIVELRSSANLRLIKQYHSLLLIFDRDIGKPFQLIHPTAGIGEIDCFLVIDKAGR